MATTEPPKSDNRPRVTPKQVAVEENLVPLDSESRRLLAESPAWDEQLWMLAGKDIAGPRTEIFLGFLVKKLTRQEAEARLSELAARRADEYARLYIAKYGDLTIAPVDGGEDPLSADDRSMGGM